MREVEFDFVIEVPSPITATPRVEVAIVCDPPMSLRDRVTAAWVSPVNPADINRFEVLYARVPWRDARTVQIVYRFKRGQQPSSCAVRMHVALTEGPEKAKSAATTSSPGPFPNVVLPESTSTDGFFVSPAVGGYARIGQRISVSWTGGPPARQLRLRLRLKQPGLREKAIFLTLLGRSSHGETHVTLPDPRRLFMEDRATSANGNQSTKQPPGFVVARFEVSTDVVVSDKVEALSRGFYLTRTGPMITAFDLDNWPVPTTPNTVMVPNLPTNASIAANNAILHNWRERASLRPDAQVSLSRDGKQSISVRTKGSLPLETPDLRVLVRWS